MQAGGNRASPQELTPVSDWGDKSAGSRFERCSQRPFRARPTTGQVFKGSQRTCGLKYDGSCHHLVIKGMYFDLKINTPKD
ncbi:hypothetical protein CUU54_10300 [Pectobacterium polaris]|nr:hypothetical protein [Pectobacterium polaris]PWD59104.1 hypothetical protein DF209_10480 [Pectobacterium polaris]